MRVTYEPRVVKEAVEDFFGIILHSRGEYHPRGHTVNTDTVIRPPFDRQCLCHVDDSRARRSLQVNKHVNRL